MQVLGNRADADIKSFFDEIDHDVILSRTLVFRRAADGGIRLDGHDHQA